MAETEDEFCRRVANRIVSEIRDIGWSSPEDVSALRARIGELEAENALLLDACKCGLRALGAAEAYNNELQAALSSEREGRTDG